MTPNWSLHSSLRPTPVPSVRSFPACLCCLNRSNKESEKHQDKTTILRTTYLPSFFVPYIPPYLSPSLPPSLKLYFYLSLHCIVTLENFVSTKIKRKGNNRTPTIAGTRTYFLRLSLPLLIFLRRSLRPSVLTFLRQSLYPSFPNSIHCMFVLLLCII